MTLEYLQSSWIIDDLGHDKTTPTTLRLIWMNREKIYIRSLELLIIYVLLILIKIYSYD